jgi:MerR family transcriptional regulator, heat shock protein HspR
VFEVERSYHISIVSKMLKMHPQTIRHYENLGLIKPQRSTGNVRLFSEQIVKRLVQINSFTELGINLAGVEVIMNLLDKMEAMRRTLETEVIKSRLELQELRRRLEHNL